MLRLMLFLLTLHRARLGYLREHPDEGSVTLEKVVITAIIVAAAVGAGVLLRNLIEGEGEEIRDTVEGEP